MLSFIDKVKASIGSWHADSLRIHETGFHWSLDINRVVDDVAIWHAQTMQAAQALQKQGEQIKLMRAELIVQGKSLAESQALNEAKAAKTQELFSAQAKQISELQNGNQVMMNELRKRQEECESLRGKFDPEIQAEKRKAKAVELQRLIDAGLRAQEELATVSIESMRTLAVE